MTPEQLKEKSLHLEHYETPSWCVDAILKKEIISGPVIDPCCGTGILGEAVKRTSNMEVIANDIEDWGYPRDSGYDFLIDAFWLPFYTTHTLLMNPPFSLAEQFVRKAIERRFRRILCFQRFAWYESRTRANFWDKHPPSRVYICGDRASCWRHDIPQEQRLGNSTPTAHAWFIWDREHIGGTLLGRIYKS